MTAVRAASSRAPEKAPELADRYHLEGCPAQRIEQYPAAKPRRVMDEDGHVHASHRTVIVVRCVDCGGEQVIDPTRAAKSVVVEPEGEG